MSDSTPSIPQKEPFALNLEAGKYFWCSCGESSNQPWCDGSHKGTDFVPVMMKLEEAKKVYVCGCKHSGKKPYCDGAHSKL